MHPGAASRRRPCVSGPGHETQHATVLHRLRLLLLNRLRAFLAQMLLVGGQRYRAHKHNLRREISRLRFGVPQALEVRQCDTEGRRVVRAAQARDGRGRHASGSGGGGGIGACCDGVPAAAAKHVRRCGRGAAGSAGRGSRVRKRRGTHRSGGARVPPRVRRGAATSDRRRLRLHLCFAAVFFGLLGLLHERRGLFGGKLPHRVRIREAALVLLRGALVHAEVPAPRRVHRHRAATRVPIDFAQGARV